MRAAAALLALLLLAQPAAAQQDAVRGDAPALLVADDVFVEDGSRLVASGNVEAFQDGTRLTASRIVYDRDTGVLSIDGPIAITDDTSRTLILADAAQMDEGLRNGLLSGARIVLDDQLQLASVEAQRVDGRYVQLSRVAVTSCRICDDGRAPLWQIRAARIIHDQQARQIYLENAQVRVLDVPVLYLPRLRLPDPTLDRARGFLFPTVRTTSLLGLGLKVPYFIPVGRHRDLTLTPYVSPKTRTLEYRYRQAFRRGDITLLGAFSADSLENNRLRSYLFAAGAFRLRDRLRLEFDLRGVSDPRYLNDYDYDDGDRLASRVSLSRVVRDSAFDVSALYYETLREEERNATQPARILDLRLDRHWRPAGLGRLSFSLEAHSHYRLSDLDIDGPDPDTVVDGRDLVRLNVGMGWDRSWTLPMGLRVGAEAQVWFDRYDIRQDAGSPATVTAVTPGAAVTLRYPLLRTGAQGGRTLLEPVVQLGWTAGTRPENPNEESTRPEFDEANLLSLSRFPAADRREHGPAAAAGLRALHMAPAGWSAALTLGRVWREDADPAFTRSSGLSGTASDWLIAARFDHPGGLSLSGRGLIEGLSGFSKAEARAAWETPRFDIGGSYLQLVSDPAEDRDGAQSEWTLDGAYRFSPRWEADTEWRFDMADQRLDRFGLGLQYRNECVEVSVSATRRLASSINLERSTEVDLTVALLGFSTGGDAERGRRSCTQ